MVVKCGQQQVWQQEDLELSKIQNMGSEWKQKFNKELQQELSLAPITSNIERQRVQWFGHFMRWSYEETVAAVVEWKPEGKIARGRPRKILWLDVVEEDLKGLGVQEWKEVVQDRKGLRGI